MASDEGDAMPTPTSQAKRTAQRAKTQNSASRSGMTADKMHADCRLHSEQQTMECFALRADSFVP